MADEMGLGKTLQTISMIGYLKYYKKLDGPFLVIVPKSTLQNWKNEFEKWTPDIKVVVLIGSQEQRQQMISEKIFGAEWDVLCTSYEMNLKERPLLKRFNWRHLVIGKNTVVF